MLRPEVKTTLDKVMYQLDLVKNSLGLLAQRINNNEVQLQSMMEYIRQEDINYVSGSTHANSTIFNRNQRLLKLSLQRLTLRREPSISTILSI